LLRALVLAATFFDQHMTLWEFREEQHESLTFRKTLVKYNSEFVNALFLSLNFRTCRLINHQFGKGNMYKDIWDMSFEARATLVVSVAFELKNDLTTDIDSLDSIECFCDFKGLFPEVITDDVVDSMKDKFIDYTQKDIWNYHDEDPDYYRDDAYKIEELAKQFEVDMSDTIKALESRATELEEEQRPDEPDDLEGYSSGRGSDSCSDSDIDSIFNTLRT
jgi:hypothetical protein